MLEAKNVLLKEVRMGGWRVFGWGAGLLLAIAPIHAGSALAASEAVPADVREELDRMKERLKALEEREDLMDEGREDGTDHRPHPLHSLAKTTLDGDITMIGQATPSVAPSAQSEGTMSVDLFFEHQVSDAGLVLLHLDVAQGQGFQSFPVFTAPNGNPTGSNNDIETFDGQTAVHLELRDHQDQRRRFPRQGPRPARRRGRRPGGEAERPHR